VNGNLGIANANHLRRRFTSVRPIASHGSLLGKDLAAREKEEENQKVAFDQ
tara:strand:+ start:436 stop:588 length:153 start_codon:yes stop_codon:yes gene_type:complete